MDNRTDDFAALLKEFVDRSFMRLNTNIPGIIKSFDPDTQTASVLPAIQMKTNIDDEEGFLSYPLLINVPVCFFMVSTNGFGITLPVTEGDSCLLVFSQRAIDHWHESGGEQPPEKAASSRHHDLTDAIAILGNVPLPDVFSNVEINGMELRNRAKDIRITMLDTKVEIAAGTSIITVNKDGNISIVSDTKVEVTAPLLDVSGDIVSGGDVSDSVESMAAHRVTYLAHTHNENGDGGGVTDPPN